MAWFTLILEANQTEESNYFQQGSHDTSHLMLAAYLVAYNIPGILPNAREPHVWTLARQIVVQPPREVAVVREADEANDESPDIPLHNIFVTVRLVLGQEAAYSALGRSWDTVCKRLIMNSLGTCIFRSTLD